MGEVKATCLLHLLLEAGDDKLEEGVIFLLLLRQFTLSLACPLLELGEFGVGEFFLLLSFTFPLGKFLKIKIFIYICSGVYLIILLLKKLL